MPTRSTLLTAMVAFALLAVGATTVLLVRDRFFAVSAGRDEGWPPPPEVVAEGGALYRANCASCHGARGEGEPNWQSRRPDGTYPAPPHDATGHTWHHADGQLFAIVRDGGSGLNSATFRSRMPAWGETLTDEQIRALVTYLKTLWGPNERAFQAEVNARDPMP